MQRSVLDMGCVYSSVCVSRFGESVDGREVWLDIGICQVRFIQTKNNELRIYYYVGYVC